MVLPTDRRQASRPGALWVLLREQASSPALAGRPLPLLLYRTFRGPDHVAEHLPANGGVACEEPAGYLVNARSHACLPLFLCKMLLQIHRIMQDTADFHNAPAWHPVKQEVPELAEPVTRRASSFAAMKEMIRSAILRDLRPRNAAGTLGLNGNFL